jgi:hypothetical protein
MLSGAKSDRRHRTWPSLVLACVNIPHVTTVQRALARVDGTPSTPPRALGQGPRACKVIAVDGKEGRGRRTVAVTGSTSWLA